jgi:hypothetical protein
MEFAVATSWQNSQSGLRDGAAFLQKFSEFGSRDFTHIETCQLRPDTLTISTPKVYVLRT